MTDITIGVNPPEEMARDARTAIQRGYDCLKVKVGIDPELDVARLAAIRGRPWPRTSSFRIDANQALERKAGCPHPEPDAGEGRLIIEFGGAAGPGGTTSRG
ncbi:MAG: enolase C-terminal domain-like protein [Faecalibacterium prausnitzii]